MARPITFDETIALQLYQQLKTDSEIAEVLGVPQSTIKSWRQRKKLPTNEIAKINIVHSEKRKSYRDALTPTQSKEMGKFLRTLAEGYRRCEERGIKPDVIGAIKAWGNAHRTEQEHAITIGFMAREKKLNKGVS